MGPSELLSVRLFKQHINEHLPDYYKGNDEQEIDSKVLKTVQLALSHSSHDSAYILKQEIQHANIDYVNLIEEYIEELASHYVQDFTSKDVVIELLIKSNNFSFNQKVEDAKELQIAIQRNERKRLKELLVEYDEQQEAEDLRIAFERLERKELKKKLQAEEVPLKFVASQRQPFFGGMWLRVAAILIVVLIPAGIIMYRNISEPISTSLAKKENQVKSEEPQYMAAEDISGLLEMDLPDEVIQNIISEIDSDIPRGQGFGNENDSKIEIRVVSKSRQMAYLQNKMDTIGRKINQINNQLKQGKVHPKTLNELKVQIEELQTAERNCRNLSEQITKAEMHYEFIKSRLTIYSNKEIDPKRFTVREEINVDTREPEYFLMLDEKEYKKLYLSQTDSIKAQKSSYSRSAYSKFFSDINRGEKLLCFYSPGCEHCVTVAKELNQLKKKASDFPEIRVCFMDEETELIPEFFKNVGAQYPYRILEVADFWETLGSSKDTPAVIYLKNGKVIKEYSGFDNRKFDKVEFGKLIGIK